jgi:GT2 family glycosyltransferase
MSVPEISAIVVNYRRPDILRACLGSLDTALARTGEATEVVVVDNASGDGSCELVSEIAPHAKLLEMPDNLGFPTAVSKGIEASTGTWVLLINNDVEVEPDAVQHMLAAARSRPRIGSVAAQMRFANDRGTINSAGIGVDRLGIAFDRLLGQPLAASEQETIEVFGACGGAALYRRAMLEEVGGFDDSFFFALDDADVSWRAQMKGWPCLYVPAAVVHHHHGATIGHGSSLKYFHVGLNRVRTVAKNADSRLLRRHGLSMIGYDLAYVAYAAITDRTLAPLRGRVKGLREWRSYRRAGASGRGPVELAPTRGLRAALARRSAWQGVSAALHTNGGPPRTAAADGQKGKAA